MFIKNGDSHITYVFPVIVVAPRSTHQSQPPKLKPFHKKEP